MAIIVITATLAAITSPAAAGDFTDVEPGSFYEDAVDWLAAEDITTGTSPTTYSPADIVTRAQMAVFLWRLMHEPSDQVAHDFTDISPGTYFAKAVAWLVFAGVTTGTSQTTYSPDDPVTRAQMAAFLWRLAGRPDVPIDHGFADVPEVAYYAVAVAWLKKQGITTGTSSSSYSPDALVTRAQMAAFLHRLATMSDWERPDPTGPSDPGDWPEFFDPGEKGKYVPYTTTQFVDLGWNVNIPAEQDVHVSRSGPSPGSWVIAPENACLVQDAGTRGIISDADTTPDSTFELVWESQPWFNARLTIEVGGFRHQGVATVIVDAQREIAVFRAEMDGHVYTGAVDCIHVVA
ncbi:MAG: hypothetical protein DHS20C19_10910 [Acidimicrobiales bacterium]|nr:MAG: hypothetical protein DHS20C19_10910 [Acidimicrobiales bacterium]